MKARFIDLQVEVEGEGVSGALSELIARVLGPPRSETGWVNGVLPAETNGMIRETKPAPRETPALAAEPQLGQRRSPVVTNRRSRPRSVDYAAVWKKIERGQKKGLTLAQIAAEVGLALSTVNRIKAMHARGEIADGPQDDLDDDHPARVARDKQRFNAEIMAGK